MTLVKAIIPGGAGGDLFAKPVTVDAHMRGGTYVAPYQATRMAAAERVRLHQYRPTEGVVSRSRDFHPHEVEAARARGWRTSEELHPPQSAAERLSGVRQTIAARRAAGDPDLPKLLELEARLSAEVEPPAPPPDREAAQATYDALVAERRAAREAAAATNYGFLPKDGPALAALQAVNDRVAEFEIAHSVPRPTTARSIRAIFNIPDSWRIPETYTGGQKRPREVFWGGDSGGRGDRMTMRYEGGVMLGQWWHWNYGQSANGGYWDKWGGPKPIAEAVAWRQAKEEEWERRRAEQQRQMADQDALETARRAAAEDLRRSPADLGDNPIPAGSHGRFSVAAGRFGSGAESGYFVRFPYSAADVAAIKAIPGRRWDAEAKEWFIPAGSADQLRALIAPPPPPPPAKQMRPYTAYRLGAKERKRLLALFPPAYPETLADHITHTYGVAPRTPAPPAPADARIVGRVDDGRGIEALVVEMDGTTDRPAGGTWHITWSREPGREARESNDAIAAGWTPLTNPVPLTDLKPTVVTRARTLVRQIAPVAAPLPPREQLARLRAGLEQTGRELAARSEAIIRAAEAAARTKEPGRGQYFGRGATTWTKRQEGWFQEKVREMVAGEADSLRALFARLDRQTAAEAAMTRRLGVNEPWRPQTNTFGDVAMLRAALQ